MAAATCICRALLQPSLMHNPGWLQSITALPQSTAYTENTTISRGLHSGHTRPQAAMQSAATLTDTVLKGTDLPAILAAAALGYAQAAQSAVSIQSKVQLPTNTIAHKSPPEPQLHPQQNTAPFSEPCTAKLKPADADATRFKLHKSVQYWRDFKNQPVSVLLDIPAAGSRSATQLAADLLQQVQEAGALRDTQSLVYWTYHTARLAYFAANAVLGLVAHSVSESLIPFGRESLPAGTTTPLQRLSSNAAAEITQHMREGMAVFHQDYEHIRAGRYAAPWDMTTITHRQYNPLFMLHRTALFMEDAANTLQRHIRNKPGKVWLRSAFYPQYYLKTFHFQTDGWMSDKSARVYEHSTEVLFFGRQDAMQRSALVPIAEWMQGRNPRDVKLLEVAAGTGRFHTFIKDNYPMMRSVCSDLSPFYLAHARENLQYWKQQRVPDRCLGGVDGTGVEFLQTAAESIAAPDASFDIVVCMYLFHELPEPVRRRAVAEMYRVLRPGGLAVFSDSGQLGDRPAWDANMDNFSTFNEPWYKSYIACDIGAMFESAGFLPGTKYMASATKTLSFTKPL